MKIKKLYLAHPFPTRQRIRAWELSFEERTGIQLTNPFYDRTRKDIDAIDRGQMDPYDLTRKYKSIVEGDLKAIDEADGLVAYHRHGIPALGTPMEILYAAFICGKPTYINTNKPGHPWLVYMARKSKGFIVATHKQFEERLLTDVLEEE